LFGAVNTVNIQCN